ncbi:hypothetical protein GTY75_05295 [Streptomyces sp. SID8381]|uniref:hypothetical protein n=1 Tax=unclassified Streptomyces TaxID=2593676 RepID=UPI00037ABF1D|nr:MULTISPECIES: hypothetical protein [unclassified Streptomyces]MYX26089.1 hypothetical protein [Streptomyces sp. SID8381]
MPQTIDAVAISRHLSRRTTQELCDDYWNLVNAKRRIPWAERAVEDVLFARHEVACLEWMPDNGGLIGPTRPHRYFGLV